MKIFLMSALAILLVSCGQKADYLVPEEIIIAGQIINYDPGLEKNILTIYVNDNGRADQLQYPSKIDSLGYFKVGFKRYYPQDVMISYITNFRVIVHPGDSLYVEFDGSTNKRTEIFKTSKYFGESAESNKQLSKYLLGYFENHPNFEVLEKYERLLSPADYILFQDSIRHSMELRRDQFIKEHAPNEEVIRWINSSIWVDYCEFLFQYPRKHRDYNELPFAWNVDDSYWSFLDSVPNLDLETLIYSNSRAFINQYLHFYIWETARRNAGSISMSNADSLLIQAILELTPDEGLIRQLTFNEYVNSRFSKYDLTVFENYKAEIHDVITEAYLIEPINLRYLALREIIEKPVFAKDIEVNTISDASASAIWDRILADGKDRVIYIDCWATWCSPCIGEIPSSNQMMEEFRDKNVEFVFLCLDSEENKWRYVLADKQFEGQHYFLNDAQGAYFKELLDIRGFPTYVIIDQSGRIVRSGSDLRPSHESTKTIIKEMIEDHGMPDA